MDVRIDRLGRRRGVSGLVEGLGLLFAVVTPGLLDFGVIGDVTGGNPSGLCFVAVFLSAQAESDMDTPRSGPASTA